MAYEQLEEIRSRKREKVALFLTAENMGGLLIATLPVYIATAHFHSFFLRIMLLTIAATFGVVVTLEYGGLPLYERVLWRIRGFMRVQTAGAALTPDQFSPTPVATHVQVLPVDGPIRAVPAADTSQRRMPTRSIPGKPASAMPPSMSPFDEVLQRDAARHAAAGIPQTETIEDEADVHV